jgi:hypothetical protein
MCVSIFDDNDIFSIGSMSGLLLRFSDLAADEWNGSARIPEKCDLEVVCCSII